MCAAKSEEIDVARYADTTPVKAGYLMQPPFGGAGWQNRYCKLYDDGIVMTMAKMDDKVPKQYFRLSAGYFVQDSRIRENAFMISDFSKTYFFGAGNRTTKLAWMQAAASVIRLLPDDPGECGNISAVSQQRVVIQRVTAPKRAPAATPVAAPAASPPTDSREAQADAILAKLMAQFDDGLTPEEQARRQVRSATGAVPTPSPARSSPASNVQAEQQRREAEARRAAQAAVEEEARQKRIAQERAAQERAEQQRLAQQQQREAEARAQAAEQDRIRKQKAEEEEERKRRQLAEQKEAARRTAEAESRKRAEEQAKQTQAAEARKREEERRQAAAATAATVATSTKPPPPPPRPVASAPATQPPPPPPKPVTAPVPTHTPAPLLSHAPTPPPKPAPPASSTNAGVETGGIDRAAMKNMWDARAKQAATEMTSNPFSQHFDETRAKASIKHDDQYGRPIAGSKTEARAKAAQSWVEQAIDKLISVICDIGRPNAQGQPHITFGELFIAYQDISDTLVGIMMRAKKRGRLEYEGDMLFQGLHDDVVITVLG